MTRVLEAKAASKLLKKAFSEKGVKVAQHEVLDLYARLQGFEAWSHLKASAKTPKAKAKAQAKEEKVGKLTFPQLVTQLFGAWYNFEDYPRKDWSYEVESDDTNLGYYDWVANSLATSDENEIEIQGIEFCTPSIEVMTPQGLTKKWDIEQNLTDRWGDINTAFLETKPGLPLLVVQSKLFNELRELKTGEYTFIVRKDSEFGILFEVEYTSRESEKRHGVDDEIGLKPHEMVVAALKTGLLVLEAKYPEIEFCIPAKQEVVMDRPAVWGFASKKVAESMTEEQRHILAEKLASI